MEKERREREREREREVEKLKDPVHERDVCKALMITCSKLQWVSQEGTGKQGQISADRRVDGRLGRIERVTSVEIPGPRAVF